MDIEELVRDEDTVRYTIHEGLFTEIVLAERGTGRGSRIVARIEDEARDAGCASLIVGWNTNERFWNKLGFTPLTRDALHLSYARKHCSHLVFPYEEDGVSDPAIRYIFS